MIVPMPKRANGTLRTVTNSLATDGILAVGDTYAYIRHYTVQQTYRQHDGGTDDHIHNPATATSA